MPAEHVQAVLAEYALRGNGVQRIEPQGNAGGWSGSRLWRVRALDGRELCLRRWPAEHPTPAGLRLIHAILELVAVELPIVAVPLRTSGGSTAVEAGGYRWELTPWLPGAADFHANPTWTRLLAAMQALARFHLLSARYERRRGAAQAIQDRRQRLNALRHQELAAIERSLGKRLGNEIDERAARLLSVARNAVEQANLLTSLSATPELWLQPAIRDIHHDHVLFSGDVVSGLIDFGSMRIDTPLTDIARLVGSLVGDDRESRRFALNVYSELLPLSDSDRALVDLLDETGLVIGALNWLVWLYIERRNMGPVGPIVKRLDELLARLERRGTETRFGKS